MDPRHTRAGPRYWHMMGSMAEQLLKLRGTETCLDNFTDRL